MTRELEDNFEGNNTVLVECIKAALLLDRENVLAIDDPVHTLLLAAGARLEDAEVKATEQYNEGYRAGHEAALNAGNAVSKVFEDYARSLEQLLERFGFTRGTDTLAWLEDRLNRLASLEQDKIAPAPSSPPAALADRHNAHEQALKDGYTDGFETAARRAQAWVAMHVGEDRVPDMRSFLRNGNGGPSSKASLLTILADGGEQRESGAVIQWFNVCRADGVMHYRAIEVVKRMAGEEEDLPQYAAIEARLLRGNPA